ncbi:radial spoke head protein 9 homolog [Cyclospora cayetanensis]|uniref:Radial spoke head protein 9 homolog n=1 Tax=Cyclospora cayetanensis TaxID=88456 RepID=A0A6P6S221_9EIME|nr:radial spoke head protein 9 homolog [Cyclospora cayetanensis]
MEASSLESGLRHLSSAGNTLNVYELTSLQVALFTLQEKEGKGKAFFWGRINGGIDDYYIAYMLEDSDYIFPKKKMFWSTGRFEFRPLPECNRTGDRYKCHYKTALCTSNAEESKRLFRSPQSDEEEGGDEDKEQDIAETLYLSSLVKRIDFATAAVPRGAHRLHGSKVIPAPEFKGLTFEEAENLSSWVHFRPAEDLEALRAQISKDYQFTTEFLQSLQADVPRGSWATRFDPVSNCVTVRSLLWPGYIAYSIVNTKEFGGVYFGGGEEAAELPFLL